MSEDEAGTLRALAAAREIMEPHRRARGRIANTAGDSVLADFEYREAVCAAAQVGLPGAWLAPSGI